MKKFICIVLCLVAIYSIFILVLKSNAKAEYTYGLGNYISGIKFNNETYIEFDYIHDWYNLICEDISSEQDKYFIERNDFFDFWPPIEYITFYNSEFDKNSNFIILHATDTSVTEIYVKKTFVIPSLKYNEVDMVCMSLDAKDENNIKDKKTVNKIVECAKSNGEIGLDKDIYDYLKENSWDNHCIYLKYEGYPLVEEFFITETDDGRYIIDQYTAEEYDTIYLDEPAHQF